MKKIIIMISIITSLGLFADFESESQGIHDYMEYTEEEYKYVWSGEFDPDREEDPIISERKFILGSRMYYKSLQISNITDKKVYLLKTLIAYGNVLHAKSLTVKDGVHQDILRVRGDAMFALAKLMYDNFIEWDNRYIDSWDAYILAYLIPQAEEVNNFVDDDE